MPILFFVGFPTAVAVLLITTLLLLLLFLNREPSWAKGIPSLPRTLLTPIIGNGNLLMKPPGFFHGVDEATKKLGPVWRMSFGILAPQVVVIQDPLVGAEIYKEEDRPRFVQGFAGSQFMVDGEPWRALRKGMNPAFSAVAIRQLYPEMQAQLEILCTNVLGRAEKGAIDIDDAMMKLTLDIITSAIFGQSFGCQLDSNAEIHKLVKQNLAILAGMNATPVRTAIAKLFGKSPTIENDNKIQKVALAAFNASLKRLEALPEAEREKNDKPILRMLRTAMEGFSEKQFATELQGLLIGGFETTAHAAAFAMHFLATRPHVQEKLYEELTRVVGSRKILTLDDISKVPYLTWVMQETLRLAPTAPTGMPRLLSKEITVAGHRIPAGTDVWVPMYTIQRDRTVWGPDADEFKPERWQAANDIASKWFPFGGGAHMCLGINLAQQELKLILSTVTLRFNWRMKEGADIRAIQLITLKPETGVPLVFTPRA